MQRARLLILVVSYNAERFIGSVLARIPQHVLSGPEYDTEVLVIDDQSKDRTFHKSISFSAQNPEIKVTCLYNPRNLGYGGNQKLGYHYAISKAFDVVVLLHGDGQYPPELIDRMVAPILAGKADAVFGSRMLKRLEALRGGMPLYKWVGNIILTTFQNAVLSSHLSEFHSGYRAYNVSALVSIPFSLNSDYFDFDTDIIIQLLDTGKRIVEIPIPTYYGEEICHVNGLRYAGRVALATVMSRVTRLGIAYVPKFAYRAGTEVYEPKFSYASSHSFALEHVPHGATVLDIGCGPGFMAHALSKKGARVISVDRQITPETAAHSVQVVEGDVQELDFTLNAETPVGVVLLLDIIEHLRSPEDFLERLRDKCGSDAPLVLITTGNVAFLPLRLALLCGQFNYGTRGILDLTHTRLFTARTLRTALEGAGYEIVAERGLPAPWPLALGPGLMSSALFRLQNALIRVSRGLFAYQLAVVCRPKPTLNQLLEDANTASRQRLEVDAVGVVDAVVDPPGPTGPVQQAPPQQAPALSLLSAAFLWPLTGMLAVTIGVRASVFTHTPAGLITSANLFLFLNTLRDHLAEYLWFTTLKPPLTFILHAVAVRLFDNQSLVDHDIFLLLAYSWDVAAAVLLYRAATLFRCGSVWSAAAVSIHSLAFVAFEQWWGGMHYDHHTLFFTALFVLSIAVFLTRDKTMWAIALLSASACLLVAQSTVNAGVAFLTIGAVILAVGVRDGWTVGAGLRRLVAVLVAPTVVVGGLVLKNYAVAGVPATSNLAGMANIMVVSRAGYLTVNQLRQAVVDADVPRWYLWCFDNATSPLDPQGVPYPGWELHARESGICYPWTAMGDAYWPHDFRPLRDHLRAIDEDKLAAIVDADIADASQRRYLFSGYSPNGSARWIAQYGAVSIRVFWAFVTAHPGAFWDVVRQLNQEFRLGASYPEELKGPDDAPRTEMEPLRWLFATSGRAYRYLMQFGYSMLFVGWGYLIILGVLRIFWGRPSRRDAPAGRGHWRVPFVAFSLPALALTAVFSSQVGGENHRYFYQITPYLLMVLLLTAQEWRRAVVTVLRAR